MNTMRCFEKQKKNTKKNPFPIKEREKKNRYCFCIMDKLIEQVQEEKRQKTLQERLREKCRNGSGKPQTHVQQQALASIGQMPKTRAMKKRAERHCSPEEYLMLQKLWDPKTPTPKTVATAVDAATSDTKTWNLPNKVIDPVTGQSRDACIINIPPIVTK